MSRRPNAKRTVEMETLESRQLLSDAGPSAEAEYMLQLINAARTNPQAAAERFTTNFDSDVQATVKYFNVDIQKVRSDIAAAKPRQPLAWNDSLASAAAWQSQDQANTGVQSHTGSDGSNSAQRIERSGYQNRIAGGENAYAYSKSVDHAMEAFLIDWGVDSLGHRKTILQPDATDQTSYQEVGIGIAKTDRPGFGPKVITQDFASRSDYKQQLLGTAFNDLNYDGSYSLGEGQGNIQIDATNLATGQTQSVQTWNSGGYQIPLDSGDYKVVARTGGRIFRTDYVTIGSQNIMLNYNLNQSWQSDSAPAPTPSAPVVSVPVQPQYQQQTAAPQNTNSVKVVTTPKSDTWFSWGAWKNRP